MCHTSSSSCMWLALPGPMAEPAPTVVLSVLVSDAIGMCISNVMLYTMYMHHSAYTCVWVSSGSLLMQLLFVCTSTHSHIASSWSSGCGELWTLQAAVHAGIQPRSFYLHGDFPSPTTLWLPTQKLVSCADEIHFSVCVQCAWPRV